MISHKSYQKICPNCEREFESHRKDKIFCSRNCKDIQHSKKSRSLNRESDRKRNKQTKRTYHLRLSYRLVRYKRDAKQRRYEWSLTDEQALQLFSQSCYWCGDEGYGIDRLDSSLGYVPENVVPCCTNCNMMKRKMGAVEFVARVCKIADRHSQRPPSPTGGMPA